MRTVLPGCALGVALLVLAAPAVQTERKPSGQAKAGFDINKRVPWNSSRVVGSPSPPAPYRAVRVFPRLQIPCPMGVAHEPGTKNLLLIHQMSPWGGHGRILRIADRPEVEKPQLLLNLDEIAYGLAFHPNYEKNGHLFVGSNGPMTGKKKYTRVTRYTVSRKPPYEIVPNSRLLILEWESDGHNGGDLAFGPDGLLYITSGDGTSDSDTNVVGQDLTTLLAKVLRIDVDRPADGKNYSVPRDNPFVGQKNVRPETWAYGFRNPWRIHVDKQTGDVWVGNNGQDLWEQIYLVQKGANYGWSVYEGSHLFYPNRKLGPTPVSKPIAEHHHSEARSMTGGVVYRGKKLPELHGAYIYGDWSTGKIWGIRHKAGKVTWHRELVDTPYQITGFGLDSQGELLIADHGGGYYTLEPAPRPTKIEKFPTRLSETGIFLSVKEHRLHPGLIPYSVNAQLWSDGAHKERFIGLVGDAKIDFTTWRGWNFPDGTVLVKTFSLDLEEGNPASRKRIETRLLVRQQGEWAGYSYIWDDAQNDATLVENGGTDREFIIKDASASGGQRKQTWHYPSRAECMVCHSRAANWVLGLTELQMNRVHDYGGGVRENQLRVLEQLGLLHIKVDQHLNETKAQARHLRDMLTRGLDRSLTTLKPWLPGFVDDLGKVGGRYLQQCWQPIEREAYKPLRAIEKNLADRPRFVSLLPKPPNAYRKLVDPYDPNQDLNLRARSYLHANCAQCHVEAGGGNALIDLEFTTPQEKMRVIDVKPQHHTFGVADARLIAPGHPERSVLYLRVARRGEGQMPQLATSRIDSEAVKLLHDWIKQMKPSGESKRGKE